ncbi:hypothetical protein EDD37DRAFT_674650 [Exophiala viscosa]|uniref:uncharacterized protein n=1 Tax=Exophiala viscosa TaxID=2486360 RepID=UPI0021A1A5DF|nr:hypothetical protein EDD37DRAFT_674650 [Exophiala viscosa]
MSREMPALQDFARAQTEFKVPQLNIGNGNIYLGDVFGRYRQTVNFNVAIDVDPYCSADDKDEAPISGGLFRMTKGDPFTATYKYHETLIVLEGSFIVTDDAGHASTASAGDIYWIPKGATVTIGTEDTGLASTRHKG